MFMLLIKIIWCKKNLHHVKILLVVHKNTFTCIQTVVHRLEKVHIRVRKFFMVQKIFKGIKLIFLCDKKNSVVRENTLGVSKNMFTEVRKNSRFQKKLFIARQKNSCVLEIRKIQNIILFIKLSF